MLFIIYNQQKYCKYQHDEFLQHLSCDELSIDTSAGFVMGP